MGAAGSQPPVRSQRLGLRLGGQGCTRLRSRALHGRVHMLGASGVWRGALLHHYLLWAQGIPQLASFGITVFSLLTTAVLAASGVLWKVNSDFSRSARPAGFPQYPLPPAPTSAVPPGLCHLGSHFTSAEGTYLGLPPSVTGCILPCHPLLQRQEQNSLCSPNWNSAKAAVLAHGIDLGHT